MKLALAVLALVAVSTAIEIPNVGRGELAKELQDFVNLMPQQKIKEITLQYYAQDAEFKAMITYFKSEGFKQLMKELQAVPEFKVYMDYMYNAGLDSYKIVNALNTLLGLPPLTPPGFVNEQIRGGVRGYIDDIMEIIPKDKVKSLYEEKMQNSPVFQDFVKKMQSGELQKLVDALYANPKFLELLKHAENANVNLPLIKDFLFKLLGIVVPPRQF